MGNWSDQSKKILAERYLKKDENGNVIETEDEMCWRVANCIAAVEDTYKQGSSIHYAKQFANMMLEQKFMPNSPTLMNAGKNNNLQWSACFVLPVEDSIPGIFDAIKSQAIIHSSGGGTGMSFSRLRPQGSMVQSTKGVASGAVSFMKIFDAATEQVKQGGCWTGDTCIATVEGNIAIKDLVDHPTSVYSWDSVTKQVVLRSTTGSWMTYTNKEVWELRTTSGVVVHGTYDHPIMLRSGERCTIQELQPGTSLMALHCNSYELVDDYVEYVRFISNEPVYNLEVDDTHNYVVCSNDKPWSNGLFCFNTRRGANMGILRIDHPDILEFIDCKLEGGIVNFNISCAVTNKFVEAYDNEEDYELIDPHTNKVASKISARYVWEKITKAAWATGDPGLFFIDRVNSSRANPVPGVFPYDVESCNPCGELPLYPFDVCLASDSLVMTEYGLRRIENFSNEGRLVSASTKSNNVVVNRATLIPKGRRSIIEVTLEGGLTIRCTPDHRFITDVGEVEAQNLISSEAKIRWMDQNPLLIPLDNVDAEKFMLGWIHGDGWMTENSIGISFNKDDGDFEIKDVVLNEYHRIFGIRTPLRNDGVSYQEQTETKNAFTYLSDNGVILAKADQRRIPTKFYTWNLNQQLSFLRGLFTADGWVGGKSKAQVQYSTSSRLLASDLQQILGSLGIQSRILTTTFDGTRKDQHRLSITKTSAKNYMNNIGFATSNKTNGFQWDAPHKYTDNMYLTVTSITDAGMDEVYDLNVPETNVFFANGILVHNCNLASINLSKFILPQNTIDWDELRRIVWLSVRFLDDVIEGNPYPMPEIADVARSIRRIGLGVMGWADMLFYLGIPYDSVEANDLAERVMGFINEESHNASEHLAIERGPFPLWERSIYKNDKPLRNATTTCVAPTGCSVGSTLVMTSNGIMRLDEIGNVMGDQWQSISGVNVAQEDHWEPTTKFYVNGKKATKNIKLSSGAIMECTLNHQYRVFDDNGMYVWRRADELQPMDRIAIRIGGYDKKEEPILQGLEPRFRKEPSKHIKFPIVMNSELAELIGIIVGNGSVHNNGIRIHFGEHLIDKIEYTISLVRKVFEFETSSYKEHTCTSIYLNSQKLLEWLKINGMLKDKSITAKIPLIIRQSSSESLTAFINGLYLADGSHTGSTKYIDTSSGRLAQELLVCLRSLGQNAKITTYSNIKGRISQNNSYRVYFRKFGSVDFPPENDRYVKRDDRDYARMVHAVGDQLWWDDVVSIEDGYAETFDIEVPENNTYLANNVVSHNTISIIANCSGGIEPIFALAFQHIVKLPDGVRTLTFVNPVFEQELNKLSLTDEQKAYVLTEVTKTGGCQHIDILPEDFRKTFITAMEIDPYWHIKMQAAFQHNLDNACSKTINMPNEATIEDISNAYWQAYNEGCLGITIFRYGSKEGVLHIGTSQNEPMITSEGEPVTYVPMEYKDSFNPTVYTPGVYGLEQRPSVLEGRTHKVETGGGTLYVTVNRDGDNPYEVFVSLGKGGSDTNAASEGLGRLASLVLRLPSNVPPVERLEEIFHQLEHIEGSNSYGFGENKVRSLPDGVAVGLRRELEILKGIHSPEDNHRPSEIPQKRRNADFCGECGNATLIYEEGCQKCLSCGLSKC